MRKIDKSVSLSTGYATWLKSLEEQGSNHPEYSSKHEYYWDVVMNLFHCQNGLCAYTEMTLCPDECFDIANWTEGRYSFVTKPEVFGDVEHFDNSLKKPKGWLWDNLFMVHSNINSRAKNIQLPDPILKPDREEYDEFSLLVIFAQPPKK